MRLVFVSSTFKDMQFERDELNIRLSPRINDFLLKYGESVRFGDLRWGVNTSELESEESSKKVLKVCLDEIDNAKPYMIVFIGERYGWIPASSLLDEAMKMKDIEDVPNDISVTNLEIEYGALLNPDYEGRILFYFRNPFDTSKMSEAERKVYESESPLHKEKLEALKKRIEELYPNYVRHYDVKYDETTHSLVGLDDLMSQIYQDLTRIFDIDFKYLNSLPKYQRAIMNSEVFFENYYKYAYYRDYLKDRVDPDSEYKEDYSNGRYEDIPCLRYVTGEPGMGRKTTIACWYKMAKDNNPDYVLPFVFGLDEFTKDKNALVSTLISFYQEKLHYKNFKTESVHTLADLIKYNDEHDKHHFQIFIMNYSKDIIIFLKELENQVKEMFHTTFYVMGSKDYKDFIPFLAFAFHQDSVYLEELNDEEKIEIIKNICKFKHKELSKVVINAIIKKEASGIPLYLSLIVERLLMLDSEDFQNIKNMGDGMEAINQYMLSVVDQAGKDIPSIIKELFKELAERINYDLVMRILYLRSHECVLYFNEYSDFFKYADIPYNELDVSLLMNTIPCLFTSPTVYDAFEFAFEQEMDVAKELSEEYIKDDFYQKYLDYIGENDIALIKKLFVYRFLGNVENFYDTYSTLINKQKMDNEYDLLKSSLIKYLDVVRGIFNQHDDDFEERFMMHAVDKIVHSTENKELKVLSVFFYNYYFFISSSNDQMGLADITLKIMRYLNKLSSNKKSGKPPRLELMIHFMLLISQKVITLEYHDLLDIPEDEEFVTLRDKLESKVDTEKTGDIFEDYNFRYYYCSMFNTRVAIQFALDSLDDKCDIDERRWIYEDYIANHTDFDELIQTLDNEDFNAWINKDQISFVVALFFEIALEKHDQADDYPNRLNLFLKVGERILQNDFFNLDRVSAVEGYYAEPLFQALSILAKEDEVEEQTREFLLDWLLIRSREMVLHDLSNSSHVTRYLSILLESGIDSITDEDFYFIYPLVFKRAQREYNRDMFNNLILLLTYNSTLYESEVDEEFLIALDSIYQANEDVEGNRFNIFAYLSKLLYARNRDVYEDQLITSTYQIITNDFELEDKKAIAKWKKDYSYFAKIIVEQNEEQ